jgi:hypothetical protein
MSNFMPPEIMWVILIAVLVITVVIVYLSIGPRKGLTHGHISDGLLHQLEQEEHLWNKETMIGAVKSTFDVLKKSYETKSSDVQADIMTINIYRDLFKNVVPNLEKLEFIRHTNLKKAEIIQVVTHRQDQQNSFSVKLSLQATDETKDLPQAVFWTFIKTSNKWLLSDISEEPLPTGYFPQGKR